MDQLVILQPYIHYSVLPTFFKKLTISGVCSDYKQNKITTCCNLKKHSISKISEHLRASRTILITDSFHVHNFNSNSTPVNIHVVKPYWLYIKPIFTKSLENSQMKEIRLQSNSMTHQNLNCLGIVIYKIADQTEGRVKIHSDFQEFSSTENYRYVLYVNCLRKHTAHIASLRFIT